LIDDEDVRAQAVQLIAEEADCQDEMGLPQDREEDVKTVQNGRREDRVASYSNVEGSCSHLSML
jgi:hypothetical protein